MHNKQIEAVWKQAEAAVVQAEQGFKETLRILKDELTYTDQVYVYNSYVMQKVLEYLKNARDAATMERANFHKLLGEPKEADPTEMIKERTQLYRDSWIVKPLNEVIRLLETAEYHKPVVSPSFITTEPVVCPNCGEKHAMTLTNKTFAPSAAKIWCMHCQRSTDIESWERVNPEYARNKQEGSK